MGSVVVVDYVKPGKATLPISFSYGGDTLHTLDDTFQNGDNYVVGHVLPAVGEGEQRVPRDPANNVVCRIAAPQGTPWGRPLNGLLPKCPVSLGSA